MYVLPPNHVPCALWLISVQSFTCAFPSLSSKFLHYSIKDFETWVIVGEYHGFPILQNLFWRGLEKGEGDLKWEET